MITSDHHGWDVKGTKQLPWESGIWGMACTKRTSPGPLRPGPLQLDFDDHFAVLQNYGDTTGVYVFNAFNHVNLRDPRAIAGAANMGWILALPVQRAECNWRWSTTSNIGCDGNPMQRRHFLQLLGCTAAYPQTRFSKGLDSKRVRALLAGRKLFIVPYSHIDWAWTHSHQWQAERGALAIAESLDIVKAMPDYRFFVDTWNEFVEPFVELYPERVDEFRRAVQSGHLAVCGGTVTSQHPMWMSQEALIRNIVLDRRLFQNVIPNLRPEVMSLFDVTPGSSQMPQILRRGGYFAFRTDRPDASFTAEGVPRNFIWQGMDGSDVLVSRGGYTGLGSGRSFGDFRSNWDDAVTRFYEVEIARMAEPRGGSQVWIPMGSDDVRPMRTAVGFGDGREGQLPLAEFKQKWNEHEEPKLVFATPVEYFRSMQKETASLPRHRGVLEPTLWTFLYGTGGDQGLRLWRPRVEEALLSGEGFQACCAALGDPYPEQQYETLWHDLLRAYSHAQTVLFSQDYAEQLDIVKKTLYSAGDLRNQALQRIAGRAKVQHNRPCILLFNDLAWDRTEVVRIWATMPPGGATDIVVHDARGAVLPHQVIEANYYRRATTAGAFKEVILLVRAHVPALGYTTIYVDPADGTLVKPETTSSGNRLQTDFADVEWSARGIEYLLDKASGARYTGLGNVMYRGYDVVNDFGVGAAREVLRWTNAQLESVTHGPLRSSFTLKGPLGPHMVRLTGHLYPHAQRISFETEIATPGGSGFFVTTAGLPEPGKFAVDVHFGVEPRDLSKIVYEGPERTFKNVFSGSHWADYSNGRYGLTVLATTGEKGFQFFPEENVLQHFLLKQFPPGAKSWWRFTTPAATAVGTHHFDYQFLLRSGDWKSGDVARRAMEARCPIHVVHRNHPLAAARQVLPEERSFVKLSPATVQLSAFYRQGTHYLARVYECSGAPARVTLDLPVNVNSAKEIDFHGEPRGKTITPEKRSIHFDIAPWEIVTIEIS